MRVVLMSFVTALAVTQLFLSAPIGQYTNHWLVVAEEFIVSLRWSIEKIDATVNPPKTAELGHYERELLAWAQWLGWQASTQESKTQGDKSMNCPWPDLCV